MNKVYAKINVYSFKSKCTKFNLWTLQSFQQFFVYFCPVTYIHFTPKVFYKPHIIEFLHHISDNYTTSYMSVVM